MRRVREARSEFKAGDVGGEDGGNLATRWHDVYLTPIQGCMYRGPMSPEVRAEQISEIDRLLDVMEKTVGGFEPGPYLWRCASTADAALFPTSCL